MQFLKGWRTVVFNGVMTVVMMLSLWSGAQVEVSGDDVTRVLDQFDLLVTSIWGIGNIILRAWTNTPIGKSIAG